MPKKTPPVEQSNGGSGVAEIDHHRIRGNLALVEQALRNNYPVKPEILTDTVAEIEQTLKDPAGTRRSRSRAMRLLLMITAQNQRDRHHVEKLESDHGILRLKMERAEDGKPNDCIALVAPVNQLPLPPHLAERAKISKGIVQGN